MCLCSQEDRAPWFTCKPEPCGFSRLKRLSKPLKAWIFRGLPIVCFQRPLKDPPCLFKGPEKDLISWEIHKAVIHGSCSFLSLSLSPNFFAFFSPASVCTRSHPAEMRHQRSLYPRFLLKGTLMHAQGFFLNLWRKRRPKVMQSTEDQASYSDFFSSKVKVQSRCPYTKKKTRGLTTPPFPDSFNAIATEIEVRC